MPTTQSIGSVGPAVIEMPPIRRLPRFAVSPCFEKEVKLKASTENLRLVTNTPPRNKAIAKASSARAPDAAQMRRGPFQPGQVEHNGTGGRPSSPPQEVPSAIRRPSTPSLQKTFHAPKSNQICTVSTARTFDPERIDALIATLAEKLTNLRARSETIAHNIDYTSRLLREIRALDGGG
uniref:Uncharacterized protein n=1 Tax=Echinococcus granulosus TaxID=6210 RepID=A0A068WIJ8_ECHGR|nr:hypothetical protein EgrG_001027000 [Echinococcus granulosus]